MASLLFSCRIRQSVSTTSPDFLWTASGFGTLYFTICTFLNCKKHLHSAEMQWCWTWSVKNSNTPSVHQAHKDIKKLKVRYESTYYTTEKYQTSTSLHVFPYNSTKK